jgi:hypothetical protein
MTAITEAGITVLATKAIKLNRKIEALKVEESQLKGEIMDYMIQTGVRNIKTRIGTLVYVNGKRSFKCLSKRYLALVAYMKAETARCKASTRLHTVEVGNSSIRVMD